jgi:tetratricopeptide (TPR) repeat protein
MNPSSDILKRSRFAQAILLGAMVALCGCSSPTPLDKQIAEEKRLPERGKPSIDYLKGAEKPLAPGSADAYRLLKAKQYKKAQAMLTRMLESELASPEEKAEYYLFRGVTNRLLVQEKAGFEDLNMSIELNPNDWRAYKARRELYENRLMHEEAAEDWEKARQLNPDLPAYQVHGGVI